MASKYEIWAPLSDLESDDRYLYHYTKIDTCFKILYYETLQFSSISCTNDIFEQKPKISLSSDDMKLQEKYYEVLMALEKRRRKTQLLCFSRDAPKLKKDDVHRDEADVTGRGFALPRMWAQYAQNNQGVCLIINKSRLIGQLRNQKIKFWEGNVEYSDSFESFPLEKHDLIDLERNMKNPNVLSNSKYRKLNYFSKLKDWESEREYRIVTYSEKEAPIIVGSLFDYLEGVIVGQNCDEIYSYLLMTLCKPQNKLVRKIFFDYTITSILDVCLQNERSDYNAFET